MDMLMNLMERLAWTSVQTALLVALVWGLCRFIPTLGAAARCRLWWLVSLQAMAGLVWAQPLQLAVLPATAAAATQVPKAMTASAVQTHAPTLVMPLTDAIAAPAAASHLPTAATWMLLLAALWGAGVVTMAWRTYQDWRRTRALLASATPCADHALVAALQMAADAHGLRRAPRVLMSGRIDAPQVVGPFRPVLLLPAERHALQGDALDMALTHELQHLQRRDLQWGLVPALAQHLFFFHPLLRVAVNEYAQAREEAVDSAVVEGRGERRQDYGRLLLQLGVVQRPHLGVASAAPSASSLKRRLRSLQQHHACPKALATTLTLAVLAVGVLPLRLVAAPQPPAPPRPPVASVAAAAPAVPAAPAPALAPEAPPAPVAPAAAPPAPPAPPAAPSQGSRLSLGQTTPSRSGEPTSRAIVTHGRLDLGERPPRAYVLVDGARSYADGALQDVEQARQDLGSDPSGFWFRQGTQRYVIRDPALLQQMQAAYAEAARVGEQQAVLGRQQGELGRRTGEAARALGRRAAEQARAALAAADINADAAAEAARASHGARGQAGEESAIAALAQQQSALGAKQAALGQRQAEINVRATREAERVIAQALKDGRAQRL